MKQNFTKYLKEICCLSSDQHFSFKCFRKKCFCKGNISKIVRTLLAALSVNGLTELAESCLVIWHDKITYDYTLISPVKSIFLEERFENQGHSWEISRAISFVAIKRTGLCECLLCRANRSYSILRIIHFFILDWHSIWVSDCTNGTFTMIPKYTWILYKDCLQYMPVKYTADRCICIPSSLALIVVLTDSNTASTRVSERVKLL